MKKIILATAAICVIIFSNSVQAQESDELGQVGVLTEEQSDVVAQQQPLVRDEVETGNFNDFVVGPGKVELQIAPGDSIQTELLITNRLGSTKTFLLSVEDVAGSDDPNTTVVLLGDDRGPYTLKDYISLPQKQIVIENGERVRVPVTVALPPDAEPGGFYGSVLVSVASESDDDQENAARSVLISRIGTLFFVTTPGDKSSEGELLSFKTIGDKSVYANGPVNFSLLFENTGTTHLNPYGELSITNIMGQEVGFIELDPWFSLPASMRSRDIAWDRGSLFGKYTATVKINRGYEDIIDNESYTFYVLNLPVLLSGAATVLALLLIIRFISRRYNFSINRVQ